MTELLNKAKQIKCLVSDVDGVLTDGLLYLDNFGNELKTFHVQDGMGLKLLMAAGIKVAVITTSRNAVIDHRMKQLGIDLYFTGQVDKREAFSKIKQKLALEDHEMAYVGDDLPDLPMIKQVGLGVAVANAVSQVKECADMETKMTGGRGAVREVCELILKAQGKAESALQEYFLQ